MGLSPTVVDVRDSALLRGRGPQWALCGETWRVLCRNSLIEFEASLDRPYTWTAFSTVERNHNTSAMLCAKRIKDRLLMESFITP